VKIEVSEQVRDFVCDCPPEPRRWLREALRKLADEKGDIKVLDGDLEGYCRLRVRSYRIIVRYENSRHGPRIFCPFVERRSVVYEAFISVMGD
jgi:mRNA-degrading endonuclease RelE of RelBE toxin-antitoxin system